MTAEDFLRQLEDALEVARGSIKLNDSLTDLGCWDSMAALTFMSVADQQLDVSVSGAQIQGCRSVKDLIGLLGNKIAN
jgi:acyl carrier protein